MNHLMVDLETLGNEPGDVIVSIGAVQFDLRTGATGKEFYREINLTQSLNEGFKVKGSTIAWWMNQEQAAREKVVSAENTGINPKQALFEFRQFIDTLEPYHLEVWGNSNRFDLGILAAYYAKFYPGKELPWHFAQERDVRTLVSFAPQVKALTTFEGTRHNPIDDCKHQIKYLRDTWFEAMGPKYVIGFDPYQKQPDFHTLLGASFSGKPGLNKTEIIVSFDKPFEKHDIIGIDMTSDHPSLYVTNVDNDTNIHHLKVVAPCDYLPTKYLALGMKFIKKK